MPSAAQSCGPDRTLTKNGKCPNCGRMTYTETVSKESCSSCGIECDYWGKGCNTAMYDFIERKHLAQRLQDEADEQRLREEY